MMTQNMKLITSPINNMQNSKPGPYHGSSGPRLIRYCENSVCKRCKPNLDNHVPARCHNRQCPTKQSFPTLYNDIPHRNWASGHNDPALQLSASSSKPDHISDLWKLQEK